jgi:hypothetical protein
MSLPEPGASAPSAVDSLARSAPRFLVYCGLLVFLLNIAVAWTVVVRSNAAINAPLMSSAVAEPSAAAAALEVWFESARAAQTAEGGGLSAEAHSQNLLLLDRLIQADFYQRLIGSNQTLQIAGMALAFSFLALGFSLYVLGIRGAFSLKVGKNDPDSSARLAFAASTPGLLCFLLAAVVTCIALTREFDVSLGGAELAPVPVAREQAREAAPPAPPARGGAADENALLQAFAEDERAEASGSPVKP